MCRRPIHPRVNAFELGARSVNPEAKTRVVVTGGWSDKAKEAAAANALIGRADEDERLRARHLHIEGRAQGTGRNHPAVADAATAIDYED